MSTTTTNYGLIKPGTDDPILIGQLNDNADAIDAALKENADAIENKPDAADIPAPSTTAPAMDGTGSAGTSNQYARADHVHPSDTSKQNALSSTQLAAVNSGIDSTKVEQIETNKNNISLLAIKGGGYNFAKIGTNSYTGYGLTLTVANGAITISGTATGNFSLYLSGAITDELTAESKLSLQLPTQIAFTGAPDTDNDNRIIFSLYNDSTWVYSGSTNDLYHNLTGKTYNNWLIYIPIVRGKTYNGTWKPMIIDKTAYDSGFTDFQPYAPSNAELYAMIQALQAHLANQ